MTEEIAVCYSLYSSLVSGLVVRLVSLVIMPTSEEAVQFRLNTLNDNGLSRLSVPRLFFIPFYGIIPTGIDRRLTAVSR